jgi:hypothetical protein
VTDPRDLPWRVGRKVGRTIYAHATDDPDGDGVLIGMMDTPALATEAVTWHNQRLEVWRRYRHTVAPAE